MKLTQDEILRRFKLKHGDKYDYTNLIYVDIDTPVEIICPKHGMFKQTPYTHTKSKYGCPKCSIKNYVTLDELVVKCKDVHGSKFNYDYECLDTNRTIGVECKKHNVSFNIKWFTHIARDFGGCNICAMEARKDSLKSDIDDLKLLMLEKHKGFYDYSLITNYANQLTKQPIKCPTHGVFYQSIYTHLKGHGCRKCSNDFFSVTRRKLTDDFITECNDTHNYKYLYDKVDYTNTNSKVVIICPTHGDFEQIADKHKSGSGCPKCARGISKSSREKQIELLLDEVGVYYESNIRPSWLDGKELDVFIPSLNLAIEFNGSVYHHSSINTGSSFIDKTMKGNNYHHSKYLYCKNKNVDLIHIFEFEDFESWLDTIRNVVTNRENYCINFHNIRRVVKVNNKHLTYFGKSYVTIKRL